MNKPITFGSSFSGQGLDWEGARFGNYVYFKWVIYRWNEYGSIFPKTSAWTAGRVWSLRIWNGVFFKELFYNCMLSSSAKFTWPRVAKDDEEIKFFISENNVSWN